MHRTKRIILITIDCLRADHVGSIKGGNYSARALTSNIDNLSREGWIFKRAFANGPATSQSFTSIFTSTYFLMQNGIRLSHSFPTLAEILSLKSDFKTIAFHSNPFLVEKLGWGRGFLEFYDFLEDTSSPSSLLMRSDFTANIFKNISGKFGLNTDNRLVRFIQRKYYELHGCKVPYLEGDHLTKKVISWITKNRDKHFFIWMHFMDPHEPYIPPDKYLHSTEFENRKEAYVFNLSYSPYFTRKDPSSEYIDSLKKLYAMEVKYVDDCIGLLIEYLTSNGLLDDTLIIILADHGQGFMEHEYFGHPSHQIYNEVLHVPLIIFGMGKNKIDDPVELLDIAPTILDLVNIEIPKKFFGKSICARANKKESLDEKPIFSESAKSMFNNLQFDFDKKVTSCIYKGWKLILNEVTNKEELYCLDKDYEETTNLSNINSQKRIELKHLIQQHLLIESIYRTRKILNQRGAHALK